MRGQTFDCELCLRFIEGDLYSNMYNCVFVESVYMNMSGKSANINKWLKYRPGWGLAVVQGGESPCLTGHRNDNWGSY